MFEVNVFNEEVCPIQTWKEVKLCEYLKGEVRLLIQDSIRNSMNLGRLVRPH